MVHAWFIGGSSESALRKSPGLSLVQVGSGLVRCWFTGGSLVVHGKFMCGSWVVRGWFTGGSWLVRGWFMDGSYVYMYVYPVQQ